MLKALYKCIRTCINKHQPTAPTQFFTFVSVNLFVEDFRFAYVGFTKGLLLFSMVKLKFHSTLGSCDFEGHSCGWNDTSKDVYRWRLERANVTSVPGHDHTTGSPRGKKPVGISYVTVVCLPVHIIHCIL